MNNWPNFGYIYSYAPGSGGSAGTGAIVGVGATGSAGSIGNAVTGLWSDPATWGGSVPLATDAVVISAGQTVYLDTTAVALSVDVQGTLRSVPTPTSSISLTTGYVNVGGAGEFSLGTAATPFPSAYTATVTLNGSEASRTARVVSGTTLGFTNNGVGRSIQVQPGGKLNLFGVSPTIKRTKLNASAAAGTNTFTLADSTGWKAGDEIVMGTTDFYGVSVPEKLTLQSNASGTTVATTTTIASPRWGALQYVTDSGMSLTAGTLTGGAPAGIGTASATPTIVDERAMVINLTRNIVIQGANDTAWTTSKFGAHCMFMGRTSDIKLDGVQFRRVGQAGAIGRYPIHWHMMSYNMPNGMNLPSDGTYVGAVVGSHYAKNCSVSESGQRMIVIHGTHGVTLDANVGFDITGHAIFLEDGSERSNTITNNAVLKVRAPTSANKLLNHDVASGAADITGVTTKQGTTAYWNTNPANAWQNNWANDCEGAGFWSSFSENYFGLSINVPNTTTGATPNPMYTDLGLIDGTLSIGNKGVGQITNVRVIDDLGNTGEFRYMAGFLTNPIKNLQMYKNLAGGYNNRIDLAQYQNFVCADNAGMDVFGQSTQRDSIMVNSLFVAESLNNVTSKRLSSYRAAFATYHELLNFQNVIAIGYTYIEGIQPDSNQSYLGGGLFRLWDLYTQGLFSFSKNLGLKLINCDAPFRTLPPMKDAAALNRRHWNIAPVIYDTNGVFGIQGKYWVLNDPFLTYGATSPTAITAGIPANGMVTTDHYFDCSVWANSNDLSGSSFAKPINVTRQDASGATVGTWNIGDGWDTVQLGNMHSLAMHSGGRYKIDIPGDAPGNYFEMATFFWRSAGDSLMIGVPFDLAANPSPVVYQHAPNQYIPRDGTGRLMCTVSNTAAARSIGTGRYLSPTGSLANITSDTTGLIYYKDTTNNVIWMQYRLFPLLANSVPYSDWQSTEYNKILVVITA